MANYGIKERTAKEFVVRDRDDRDFVFHDRKDAEAFIREQQEIDREIARQALEARRAKAEREHREGYFAILQREMNDKGLNWLRGDCYLITRDNFPEIAKHFGYAVRKLK